MIKKFQEFKLKYLNIKKNTDIENTHLWQIYLRIFSIFMTTILPILLISFFVFQNRSYDEQTRTYTIEAIAYTLNLVFISFYYSVLFICLISTKIKKDIKNSENSNQRKRIIDTSLLMLITLISFILLIFITLSLIYALTRADKLGKQSLVSEYILNYMYMIIPIILFSTISNFFINLSFTLRDINLKLIYFLLYLFGIVEIIAIYFLLKYSNFTNIIIILCIPTLVISFMKMIYFSLFYLMKNDYFKTFKNSQEKTQIISFYWTYYRDLFIKSKIPLIFATSYTLSLTTQSIFINFSYSINSSLSYLFTKDGYYINLFAKIVVYNLIYIIFIFSRIFNIALIERSFDSNSPLEYKIYKRSFYRKLYLLLLSFIILICFISFLFLNSIVTKLFEGFSWYQKENIITNDLFPDFSVSQLVNKFIKEGFVYGVVSFALIEFLIANRNIISKTDKRNNSTTWVMIVSYSLSISILSYVFSFVLNTIFYGLSGYFVAFIIYSSISLILMFIFDWLRTYHLYQIKFEDQMKNLGKLKFIFWKWKIDFSIKKTLINIKVDILIYIIFWIIIIMLITSMIWLINT